MHVFEVYLLESPPRGDRRVEALNDRLPPGLAREALDAAREAKLPLPASLGGFGDRASALRALHALQDVGWDVCIVDRRSALRTFVDSVVDTVTGRARKLPRRAAAKIDDAKTDDTKSDETTSAVTTNDTTKSPAPTASDFAVGGTFFGTAPGASSGPLVDRDSLRKAAMAGGGVLAVVGVIVLALSIHHTLVGGDAERAVRGRSVESLAASHGHGAATGQAHGIERDTNLRPMQSAWRAISQFNVGDLFDEGDRAQGAPDRREGVSWQGRLSSLFALLVGVALSHALGALAEARTRNLSRTARTRLRFGVIAGASMLAAVALVMLVTERRAEPAAVPVEEDEPDALEFDEPESAPRGPGVRSRSGDGGLDDEHDRAGPFEKLVRAHRHGNVTTPFSSYMTQLQARANIGEGAGDASVDPDASMVPDDVAALVAETEDASTATEAGTVNDAGEEPSHGRHGRHRRRHRDRHDEADAAVDAAVDAGARDAAVWRVEASGGAAPPAVASERGNQGRSAGAGGGGGADGPSARTRRRRRTVVQRPVEARHPWQWLAQWMFSGVALGGVVSPRWRRMSRAVRDEEAV